MLFRGWIAFRFKMTAAAVGFVYKLVANRRTLQLFADRSIKPNEGRKEEPDIVQCYFLNVLQQISHD